MRNHHAGTGATNRVTRKIAGHKNQLKCISQLFLFLQVIKMREQSDKQVARLLNGHR